MRGTVKIIDPRWCQNHDYARSKVGFDITEGLLFYTVPQIKSSQHLFYIPNERNKIFNLWFF